MRRGILAKEGFYYEIEDTMIEKIGAYIYGSVQPEPLYASSKQGFLQGRYAVVQEQLFLASFSVCIKADDIAKVNHTFLQSMTVEYRKRIEHIPVCPLQTTELAVLTFSNLHLRIPYSTTITGRQVYQDEVIMHGDGKITVGSTYQEASIFVFADGMLHPDSKITRYKDTYISKYTFNEEIYQEYLKKIERSKVGNKAACREIFFVDPKPGLTYTQALTLIGVNINYRLNNITTEKLLKSLIVGRPKPIFRIQYMVAEGKEVREVTLDLVEAILEKEDLELLKNIYPYIDLNDYPLLADQIQRMVDPVW